MWRRECRNENCDLVEFTDLTPTRGVARVQAFELSPSDIKRDKEAQRICGVCVYARVRGSASLGSLLLNYVFSTFLSVLLWMEKPFVWGVLVRAVLSRK